MQERNNRDRVVILTKCGNIGLGGKVRVDRKVIEKELEESLDALQTDYIDIYLLHHMEENHCMPDIRPGDMERICKPLDFFGMNCYNRVLDCADPELLNRKEAYGGNYLDNGMELYSQAGYDALHILHDEYQIKIPVYITENGVPNCNEEILPDGRIIPPLFYEHGIQYFD